MSSLQEPQDGVGLKCRTFSRRLGEGMGEVQIQESSSLDSVTESMGLANNRTRVLLLGSRDERVELREHGATVELADTAISIFYRPRVEREDIAAAGLDHAVASFQFLDISMGDLGRWLQPLIAQGWVRKEISIVSASTASFPDEDWVCFHHPVIPAPDRLPLAGSPGTIERRAYLSLAGAATKQATTRTPAAPAPAPTPTPKPVEEAEVEETEEEPEAEAEPEVIAITNDEPLPVIARKEESPLEAELRQTISLLVAGGLDVADVMEHEQFIEVSERANAAGIDVWGMVVKLSD
jgi:hypothetical protein